jgi:hypothetical protein
MLPGHLIRGSSPTCAGYEVQTLRIVTRALSAARSAKEAAHLAALLERLCLAHGVTLLSLGATSDAALLQQGFLLRIAACTSHTSCSFRSVSSYLPAAMLCLLCHHRNLCDHPPPA